MKHGRSKGGSIRRVLALGLVASFALGGLTFAREGEGDDSDLAWFHGGWNLGYLDSELGMVLGRADIAAATGMDRFKAPLTANLKLRHPKTGRIYTLSLSSQAMEGDALVLNLEGKSPPSGYHVDEDAFKEAVGEPIPLEIGAGDTVEVTVDEESETVAIVEDEAPDFLQDVTVKLTVPAEGEPSPLAGTWSYELSSPRQMRQGRAGDYDEAEKTASGREAWERPVPRITSVTDVDMPTRRELGEMHRERRRRGEGRIWVRPGLAEERDALQAEYGPEAYARFWLRIDGYDLPTQPRRHVEVEFENDKIIWTGNHRPNEDKPEFLDVQVVLKKGIVAGVKKLTLNGAPGEWHYDVEPGQIRYVRMISAAEPEEEIPAGFELVNDLYLGEVFYVELEYHEDPPFDERKVGSVVGGGGVVEYTVAKLPNRPTVLRSKRILIDAPPDEGEGASAGEGETGLSSAAAVFIPAAAGTRLFTTDVDSTAPSKGKPIGVARVLAQPPSLWEKAIERAKYCREKGLSETEVSHLIVSETLLYAIPALAIYKEIRWGSDSPTGPIRRSLNISLDDHAAAILLRDELVSALGQYTQGERRSLSIRPDLPTEGERLRHTALAASTASLIGSARSFVRYENEALLNFEVDLPKGATDLDGSTTTRLANALGSGMEDRWFKGDRDRFLAYAMGAVTQARRELADRAENSEGMAAKPTDCEVVKILAMIRNVSGPIAQRIAKKLMRAPKGDEPRVPRWVPDYPARAKVASLYLLAQAIKDQEDYSSIDTDVAVTLATLPVMAVGGAVGAAARAGSNVATAARGVSIANWMLDAVDVGFLANDIYDYSEAVEGVEFAEGLVGIVGTRPLEKAKAEAEAAAWGVAMGGGILAGQAGLHALFSGIGKVKASRAAADVPTVKAPDEAIPPKPGETDIAMVPSEAPTPVRPRETEVAQPRPTEPEVAQPRPTEPEVAQPRPTEPEVAQPRPTEPEVARPRPTEPEVARPRPTEPEVAQPRPTEPEVAQPRPTEPEVAQPRPTEPEVARPRETEVVQPRPTEPEVARPRETEVVQPRPTEPE
ncbi:MAG: hypothetical protein V3U18_09760, partial [Alphaproteobacteria bacterium]